MYDEAKTSIKNVFGETEHFTVKIGVYHQGRHEPSFVFAGNELTKRVQDEAPWRMTFANYVIIVDDS